jgi:predicted RNase H-like nuclease (RuvC/YqgF family)
VNRDPIQDLREILKVTIKLVTRLRNERNALKAEAMTLKSEVWVLQRKMEILEREYSKIKIHLND